MINIPGEAGEEQEIPESSDSRELFDSDHPWHQFEIPGHPDIRLCLRAKNDDLYAKENSINHIIAQYYVLGNGDYQPTRDDIETGYHLAYEIVSRSTEGEVLRHPKSEFILELPPSEEIDRYLASL